MEIENLKYGNVPSLDVMEMETVLKQYPWFSYLREVLMEKLYRLDEEAFREELKLTAVFLASRKTLYDRIHAPAVEEEEIEEVPAPVEVEVHRPRVIVAGGDFFSKEDLKSISPEDDMEVKLRTSPFYRPAEETVEENQEAQPQASSGRKSSLFTEDGKVNYDDLAFCTETLGHIYAQQGFYDKAIEVFSKLILLYPQKSAYFAALVNDLKNNLD